ncbi:MAG: hypothetical protein K6E83_05080 [Clostridium sp.]|nr:hypothetical protein [Clostridium sp.]
MSDLRYEIRNGKKTDRFMHAWMMLKVAEQETVTFFNRRKKEEELRGLLRELCIIDCELTDEVREAWKTFAGDWIRSCAGSSTYRSVIFGMVNVKDDIFMQRICHDIDLVTRQIPARFHLEEACLPFREVLCEEFTSFFHTPPHFQP